jgi:hypothetical protein
MGRYTLCEIIVTDVQRYSIVGSITYLDIFEQRAFVLFQVFPVNIKVVIIRRCVI